MEDAAPESQAAVNGLATLILAINGYRLAAADYFELDIIETHAIGYLDAHGPMTQSRLAKLLDLTTGALTGIVDRLERRGTARRTVDPHDRRRNRVELTDKSRRMLAESNASLARTFDQFPPETVRTLIEALPKLAAGLDHEAEAMRR